MMRSSPERVETSRAHGLTHGTVLHRLPAHFLELAASELAMQGSCSSFRWLQTLRLVIRGSVLYLFALPSSAEELG